ncbi:hypothetical protein BDQ12DRAFT_94077 [Crucibulum laeve]|uniref:Uncharacterized protein n=1 Tax=Crucibulum laeve TaxID=68775 RepID=A0A5C3LG10_9AGAR|nr:hypothetical protein BDQ12DRAFT_94077 [Crucibulum laeve]
MFTCKAAVLTSGTRGAGGFAVAAAAMEPPMHRWNSFKAVQDVLAGGGEVSKDALREPTSKASLESPSKHFPLTTKRTLPVLLAVSMGMLRASPLHLSKQLSSPETSQSLPSLQIDIFSNVDAFSTFTSLSKVITQTLAVLDVHTGGHIHWFFITAVTHSRGERLSASAITPTHKLV